MRLGFTSSLTLRSRFLLVVLLGVVLPIALVALWLTHTTRVSGEAVLRGRLEQSLGDAVSTVGLKWVRLRADLLELVSDPAVQSALRQDRSTRGSDPASALESSPAWTALRGTADRIVIRDTGNRSRVTVERGPTRSAEPALPVRLPVYGDDGHRLGTLEFRLRLSSLLSERLWWPGAVGATLGVFDAQSGAPLLPAPLDPGLFGLDRFAWNGQEWLAVRHRLHEPPVVVALAAPIDPFMEPFSRAARSGTVAFAVVLVLSLVLAAFLTRRMTGPLERLAGAADAVSRGELTQQLHEEGPDEIRRVTGAFNAMTESLRSTLRELSQKEAMAAVGEFASALAHGVRNPLTSIRLDLERARERTRDRTTDELVGRAVAEIERLDATVRGSLRLARSGSLSLEPTDLRAPLKAAIHAAEPEFRARGATLGPDPPFDEPLIIRGSEGALEELFLNLLLNAAEAAGPGGRATIDVTVTPDNVRVSVSDTGPGIPPDLLDRVFEPFYSGREDGTGLGLPIARRIAHAHGGELAIDSASGSGTVVHVSLPRKSGTRARA